MEEKNNNDFYRKEREFMVENHLRLRGIKDHKVLNAMLKVPREKFVPENEILNSYYDGPLRIGYGQTISQPYIVAYMTELLELQGTERVLELGTGCGYQTSILAELTKEVYTIEIIEILAKTAKKLLTETFHYKNIFFKQGDGKNGWQEYAPFDRILLTAAPEQFPDQLFDQLDEGGIILAPVGGYFQRMYKYWKVKGKIEFKPLIGVSFVQLV